MHAAAITLVLASSAAAALAAPSPAAATFTCIKPVNPIPAGPPGACCQELDQSFLLPFLYTGKICVKANKISEAKDGKTTYEACPAGAKEACCDPLLMALDSASNPACVLPTDQ